MAEAPETPDEAPSVGRTPEEVRAYQRGYAAGRKRTAAEDARHRETLVQIGSREHAEWREDQAARRAARVAVFCAALQGTLAADQPWKTNGKPWRSVAEYVRGCLAFVAAAENQGLIK